MRRRLLAPKADYTAVNKLIAKINSLDSEKYTQASWKAVEAAVTSVIYNLDPPEQSVVNEYANAIETARRALVRVYTITVDGEPFLTGEFNTMVELTAAAEKNGLPFAGWEANGIVVSKKNPYIFAISNDSEYTAIYSEQEIELKASALLENIIITEREDGKENIKVACKLIVPEGYTLKEAGVFRKLNGEGIREEKLYSETGGAADGVSVTKSSAVNMAYQFSVTLNGLGVGRTVNVQVYMKVTTPANKVEWYYSEVGVRTND